MYAASRPAASPRRILLLGADMAGLGAARRLHDAGVDVSVIEARNRIGGRTFTSTLWPDLPVDMGASWIHGTTGNPVTDLAAEVGATWTATSYMRSVSLAEDGKPVDFQRAVPRAFDLLEMACNGVTGCGPDVSLQAAVRATPQWKRLTAQDKRMFRAVFNTRIEHEYSGDWSRLSARSFDDGQDLPGDEAVIDRGYGPLVARLARGLDIRLDEAVTAIAPTTTGVTVTTAGGTHKADHAIVTLPLGILKSGTIRLAEPLAGDRQRAIDRLEMGLLNKCWLRFDRVFWPPQVDWIDYLGPVEGLWANWLSGMPGTGQPLLVGFNAAAVAEQMETLDDRATIAAATDALRAMFGTGIPDPQGGQVTRWRQDPFARGSYSFNAVGSSTLDRRALFGSDWQGRLIFAGEASSHDHPGTAHGALMTGRAAALALAR